MDHCGYTARILGWTILVLISKGNIDTQGIGLLETLWNVMDAIIDTCLRSRIQFHDVIHGFRAGRGTGTSTMELKLSQYFSRVDQYSFFLVFLKLRKSYNTVDRGRFIRTLEGYGAGPQMFKIPVTFWDHQEVITSQTGYHGPNFIATRNKTQGGLI